MKETYLGDSVYAMLDAFGQIVLYLDNGLGPFNQIALEPKVYQALVEFADRAKEEIKCDT